MAAMICELERNLIEICKSVPASAMGDFEVMTKQKPFFYKIQPKKPVQIPPPSIPGKRL